MTPKQRLSSYTDSLVGRNYTGVGPPPVPRWPGANVLYPVSPTANFRFINSPPNPSLSGRTAPHHNTHGGAGKVAADKWISNCFLKEGFVLFNEWTGRLEFLYGKKFVTSRFKRERSMEVEGELELPEGVLQAAAPQ